VYLLLHRSVFGQRFERDGLLGSAVGGVLRVGAREFLDLVTIGAVLLVAAVLCAMAVSRGSTGQAGVVASTLVASIASAEIFKTVPFPRPNLLGGDAVATATSFPSGTVAAVAALGVGFVSVAPPAWRRSASRIGMSITAVAGISVLLLGWHRASDAVGGLALAFGWFAIGLAVLRTYSPDDERQAGRVSSLRRPWTIVGYLTMVGAALVAIVELSRDGEPARATQIIAFLAGCLLFLAADIGAYTVLARAARVDRRDPPPSDSRTDRRGR
jgi:membrane-associated phospholipid phosphatase